MIKRRVENLRLRIAEVKELSTMNQAKAAPEIIAEMGSILDMVADELGIFGNRLHATECDVHALKNA